MKKITMALVALSLLVAKTALAAVPAPNGLYVEGNIGQSFAHVDDSYPGLSINEKGLGGSANVGYKLNPYLAAEAGYTYYAPTTGKYAGVEVGKIKQSSADIAAKGILPISDTGLELFGKLGVAYIMQSFSSNYVTTSDDSRHVTSPYFGVGAQYSFTSNIIGNVQFDRAKGNSDTGSLDLASVGISYLFS